MNIIEVKNLSKDYKYKVKDEKRGFIAFFTKTCFFLMFFECNSIKDVICVARDKISVSIDYD